MVFLLLVCELAILILRIGKYSKALKNLHAKAEIEGSPFQGISIGFPSYRQVSGKLWRTTNNQGISSFAKVN